MKSHDARMWSSVFTKCATLRANMVRWSRSSSDCTSVQFGGYVTYRRVEGVGASLSARSKRACMTASVAVAFVSSGLTRALAASPAAFPAPPPSGCSLPRRIRSVPRISPSVRGVTCSGRSPG